MMAANADDLLEKEPIVSKRREPPKADSCEFLIKYNLIICNIVITFLSIVLIYISWIALHTLHQLSPISDWRHIIGRHIYLVVIVFCAIQIASAISGLAASRINSPKALAVYSVVCAVVGIAFLVIGLTVISHRGLLIRNYKRSLVEAFFQTNSSVGLHEFEGNSAIYKVQASFQCCGVNNYLEWQTNVTWLQEIATSRPGYIHVFRGCCHNNNHAYAKTTSVADKLLDLLNTTVDGDFVEPSCGYCLEDPKLDLCRSVNENQTGALFEQGCYTSIGKRISKESGAVCAFALVISFAQLAGAVLVTCFSITLKRTYP